LTVFSQGEKAIRVIDSMILTQSLIACSQLTYTSIDVGLVDARLFGVAFVHPWGVGEKPSRAAFRGD